MNRNRKTLVRRSFLTGGRWEATKPKFAVEG